MNTEQLAQHGKSDRRLLTYILPQQLRAISQTAADTNRRRQKRKMATASYESNRSLINEQTPDHHSPDSTLVTLRRIQTISKIRQASTEADSNGLGTRSLSHIYADTSPQQQRQMTTEINDCTLRSINDMPPETLISTSDLVKRRIAAMISRKRQACNEADTVACDSRSISPIETDKLMRQRLRPVAVDSNAFPLRNRNDMPPEQCITDSDSVVHRRVEVHPQQCPARKDTYRRRRASMAPAQIKDDITRCQQKRNMAPDSYACYQSLTNDSTPDHQSLDSDLVTPRKVQMISDQRQAIKEADRIELSTMSLSLIYADTSSRQQHRQLTTDSNDSTIRSINDIRPEALLTTSDLVKRRIAAMISRKRHASNEADNTACDASSFSPIEADKLIGLRQHIRSDAVDTNAFLPSRINDMPSEQCITDSYSVQQQRIESLPQQRTARKDTYRRRRAVLAPAQINEDHTRSQLKLNMAQDSYACNQRLINDSTPDHHSPKSDLVTPQIVQMISGQRQASKEADRKELSTRSLSHISADTSIRQQQRQWTTESNDCTLRCINDITSEKLITNSNVVQQHIAAKNPQQRRARNEAYRRRRAAAPLSLISTHKTAQQQQTATSLNVRDYSLLRRRTVTLLSKCAARNPTLRPVVHDVGKKDIKCSHCNALHFRSEMTVRGTFSGCCASGQVKLPSLTDYPALLHSWLTATTSDARHFRENIRRYNSAFAFASFGFKPVQLSPGPQTFIIHGQVYHKTSLTINGEEHPTYAQLYFLDPDYANRERIQNDSNKQCRLEFIAQIDQLIRSINPYAEAYKMMRDYQREQHNPCSVQMWITQDRQHDPRLYNLPVANEVAAVFVSENGEPPFNRDISVHPVGDYPLQNLRIISPNCDPMTYPLLFPHGDPGWQPGIQKVVTSGGKTLETDGASSSRNVSMLQFYSFRLQERNTFNPLLHSGKLTQQFIIDAYLKVEGQRLHWTRQNQKKLRVDLYMGLMDFVHNQAQQHHLKAGRLVILPSTFTGGKRALQQNYQDAMALVAKFGKPDLFVTFTCNPKWTEIADAMMYGESPIDRPDVVATVFYLKVKEFLKDMTGGQRGVLGSVKAYLSVIEFQKRGLPHCHMLFILDDGDKLREPEDIDKVVCAEIPDPTDSQLLDIVTTCMLHGPCGDMNKKAPCMAEVKGVLKCTKDFPKPFSESTNANVHGYPLYRRRNNGRQVTVRGASLDNRYVVPYNPYLTRKYNAHINVEVCSSVQSVKYIFKYIYKGHDAAVVKVAENGESGIYNWDEVQTFLDTRYISAPEAMWRLRRYEMFDRSHAVERLPVHLPFQQSIFFEEGHEEEQLEKAVQKGTKLTKWFSLNAMSDIPRHLLYTDIPYHYVWNNNRWKIRRRGAEKILPRMYTVCPKNIELFSLRLLLLHVRGAQSYEHLKTIDGVLYDTFHGAAKALNLLSDDREWHNTMNEACVFQLPHELRHLFAVILIHGIPSDAVNLYQSFKVHLLEDYLSTHCEYMAEEMALRDINNLLLEFGTMCSTYGLPSPHDSYDSVVDTDVDAEREESARLLAMMNADQLHAYGLIMAAVNGARPGKCYFLSGAGGCGKTFVYRALTAAILSQGGVVKSVAPTGLASTLLKGGRTVHSGFGIPVDVNEFTMSRIKHGSPEWKELQHTKLIIWDEITMSHAHLLTTVDRSLRDLLTRNEPFGGITIVVGGDFRQQAPVVPHGKRVQIVEACVKSSPIWHCFEELHLSKNMRVRADELQFTDWLLAIGEGRVVDSPRDWVKIPSQMLTEDLITTVFGTDISSTSPTDLATRAILCPKNASTLQVNQKILALLDGPQKVYYSVDTVSDAYSEAEATDYPMEFLNSLTPMGLPPHALALKKGCCVTLLRNLNPKRGLCNGTRLIVETMSPNLIECSVFTGVRRGEKVFIPRIPLTATNSDLPFQLNRKQFPLRLAYAMTITKAQGQTFDRIGVYLPEPVFTHGQLYTAFSRVRSQSGLFVQIESSSRQGAIGENLSDIYTFNCVYRELLR